MNDKANNKNNVKNKDNKSTKKTRYVVPTQQIAGVFFRKFEIVIFFFFTAKYAMKSLHCLRLRKKRHR